MKPIVFHSLKVVLFSSTNYELQQVVSNELLFCPTLKLVTRNSWTSISLKKLVKIEILGRGTRSRHKNNMKKHTVLLYGSH